MMKKVCGFSARKDDRITHLPEPIRFKVISFLPMEEAIRTSVLSKEWRYVPASLPNLELNQHVFENRDYDEHQFRNIVDRLLLSRDRVDIEKFELFVKGGDDLAPLHINTWILSAIRNNVRQFHLALWSDQIIIKLPCCLFQCPTVTDLRLVGRGLHLQVPPNAVLARLKRCTLMFFNLYDDTFMRKLFCSCPSIEELTLKYIYIEFGQNTFTISSPNLKILTLDVNPGSSEITINAKNLQKIEYTGTQLPTMSSETLCSLLRANFASHKLSKHRDCGVNSILYGMRNVVRLSLCEFYVESMSRHPNSLECLASCSSLRHLELEISPICRHVNLVLTLLKIYKKIVTLRVSFQIDSKFTNILNDQQMNSDKCMLEQLNTVELKDFGGSKEELHIVRYILENTTVLEKMKIIYLDAQRNNATTRMMVSEELLNVTKASAVAMISFE